RQCGLRVLHENIETRRGLPKRISRLSRRALQHRRISGVHIQSEAASFGSRIRLAGRIREWRHVMRYPRHPSDGDSVPATLGFNAVAPESPNSNGAAPAAPAIPATESTLGSHPCVALSSAQLLSEWINRNLA